MTLLSVRPVTLRISSKVMRSAHAAQIIQSGEFFDGSGFLTRVTGLLDCFGFMENYLDYLGGQGRQASVFVFC